MEGGPPPQEPSTRRCSIGEQQAGARERPDRGVSVGRELQGVFLGPSLRTENRQLEADRDRSIREGSLLQGRIHGRQQELGKEWGDLDEEGLRTELRQAILLGTELRQAIGALQIEDHKMEEPLEKNLHRREEQDKPMQTSSMTRGQTEGSRMSSMAESKSRTPPVPLGSSTFTVLDPGSPKKSGAEAGEGCYQDR